MAREVRIPVAGAAQQQREGSAGEPGGINRDRRQQAQGRDGSVAGLGGGFVDLRLDAAVPDWPVLSLAKIVPLRISTLVIAGPFTLPPAAGAAIGNLDLQIQALHGLAAGDEDLDLLIGLVGQQVVVADLDHGVLDAAVDVAEARGGGNLRGHRRSDCRCRRGLRGGRGGCR